MEEFVLAKMKRFVFFVASSELIWNDDNNYSSNYCFLISYAGITLVSFVAKEKLWGKKWKSMNMNNGCIRTDACCHCHESYWTSCYNSVARLQLNSISQQFVLLRGAIFNEMQANNNINDYVRTQCHIWIVVMFLSNCPAMMLLLWYLLRIFKKLTSWHYFLTLVKASLHISKVF